jgi:hypothetical protein
MGLFDRWKERKSTREVQSSSATSQLSTAVSTSSPQQSMSEAEQQALAEALALKKFQEEEAARKAAEEAARQEAARLEAERQAAADARAKAAALEQQMAAVKTEYAVQTGTTTEKTPEEILAEEQAMLAGGQTSYFPAATQTQLVETGDVLGDIASNSMTSLGSNLESSVSLLNVTPEKTPAELAAERQAAADSRLKLSTMSSYTSEAPLPTLEPINVSGVSVESPIEPVSLSFASEPSSFLSQELPTANTDFLSTSLPSTETTSSGLAEGTTRLLSNIYATPTTEPTVGLSALSAEPSMLSSEPSTLFAEPTAMTMNTETTLLEGTTDMQGVLDNALADAPAATTELPKSYEPTSSVGSGFTLLSGGGTNTDPYAPVSSTKIEQAIAGSGGTMDSYNTFFDTNYAQYFVDETLSAAEADALLAAAPTRALSDIRIETRSYEPSSKVENLFANSTMGAKGNLQFIPDSDGEGFVLSPEILAQLAEVRALRQAQGLPVKEEGRFWKLDENGNLIPKEFANIPSYRGSTGVNAGPGGGGDQHSFNKGSIAQKRAVMRNYMRRGATLVNSQRGTGYAVDFYDDADDTWDVYGYDFPTATSPGSVVPKFYESSNKDQAQKVYDTWVKAYGVKYQGATPAQRAAVRRQAGLKAQQQMQFSNIQRGMERRDNEKKQEARAARQNARQEQRINVQQMNVNNPFTNGKQGKQQQRFSAIDNQSVAFNQPANQRVYNQIPNKLGSGKKINF